MTENSQEVRVQENNDEVSLKELILRVQEWYKYFLSKWIVIVLFGLLGGGLGLAYAWLKKTQYIATTTFVLEEDKAGRGLGSLAGLASMAGVDIGGGGSIFQGDNILELYKSRNMLERALLTPINNSDHKELLIDRFIAINKLKETWTKKPELLALKFSGQNIGANDKIIRLKDSLLSKAVEDINRSYLSVSKPDKKLSIIKVDVKSKDELFSKALNDILVKNVNEFYVQTKTKKSKENVEILQRKTDSVRAVMNGDIYSAVAVADATPNLNPTRQIKRVAPAQRAQFSAETNKLVLVNF